MVFAIHVNDRLEKEKTELILNTVEVLRQCLHEGFAFFIENSPSRFTLSRLAVFISICSFFESMEHLELPLYLLRDAKKLVRQILLTFANILTQYNELLLKCEYRL